MRLGRPEFHDVALVVVDPVGATVQDVAVGPGEQLGVVRRRWCPTAIPAGYAAGVPANPSRSRWSLVRPRQRCSLHPAIHEITASTTKIPSHLDHASPGLLRRRSKRQS
jgi:hypothetical protein